jgi:hypothetical protein
MRFSQSNEDRLEALVRPRSWEAVRTMFSAPADRRWAGVPETVDSVNTLRTIESQREQRI